MLIFTFILFLLYIIIYIMDALLFLGMMGSGYVYNSLNKKQDVDDQPDIKNGNTVYDKNIVNENVLKKVDNLIPNLDFYNEQNRAKNKIKSDISSEYIDKIDFLTNDKGIRIQPHFIGSGPGNSNIDSSNILESKNGYEILYPKKEIPPHFKPTKNSGNVFGSTFDGVISDKNRYNLGNNKKNELSFEQIQVVPMDIKSEINGDVSRLYSERNSVENTRSLSNPKDTYEGRVISGKYIDKRGEQAPVAKNKPYRDYKNSPLRNFTTVAEVEGQKVIAKEILKPTSRTYLNRGEIGIASGGNGVYAKTRRPLVQKTMKTALGTSTERNARLENPQQIDYNLLGYNAKPNERQVTVERTHQSNLKTYIDKSTLGLQDPVKKTIKQTTMYDDVLNPTTYVYEDSSRLKYCNMNTDPTKEIISKERDPTLSNVKLTNGKDKVNLDIKKIEQDYITQHGTNISKIYGKIPSDNTCQITKDKDTLNNKVLSDRIYPDLLDPFRKNPLTQPLSSYSFN